MKMKTRFYERSPILYWDELEHKEKQELLDEYSDIYPEITSDSFIRLQKCVMALSEFPIFPQNMGKSIFYPKAGQALSVFAGYFIYFDDKYPDTLIIAYKTW